MLTIVLAVAHTMTSYARFTGKLLAIYQHHCGCEGWLFEGVAVASRPAGVLSTAQVWDIARERLQLAASQHEDGDRVITT